MTQPSLFVPLPSVRKSATSRAAAASISASKAEEQRRSILAAVQAAGANGLTDAEIQHVSGVHADAERPRRGELVRRGSIKDSSRVRPTASGRAATVWVAAHVVATA